MGEIDELEYTIDHSVPKGNQGIDGPNGQTIRKLLKEFFHYRAEELRKIGSRQINREPMVVGAGLRLQNEFTFCIDPVDPVHFANSITFIIKGYGPGQSRIISEFVVQVVSHLIRISGTGSLDGSC